MSKYIISFPSNKTFTTYENPFVLASSDKTDKFTSAASNGLLPCYIN